MCGVQAPKTQTRQALGLVVALVLVAASGGATTVARSGDGTDPAPTTAGYWLVSTDGGVFSFGRAGFHGSTGDIALNQPIVGAASTPSGRGYWLVAADGGIFAFGAAGFYGSMGGKPLNKPIVAMAPTSTGRGYWLVAADGGIFAFGDAGFYGSMGGEELNKPIVGLAATPSGRGYWLAATNGDIVALGDAAFYGSTGDFDLAKRIHALVATSSGRGYWMVAGDGGIFSFGDAGYFGSAVGEAKKRVIAMAPSVGGRGYFVSTSEGQVLAYGDAAHYGDTQDIKLNNRIAAMIAMNGNEPPVAIDDVVALDEDGMVTIDVLANDRDPEGGPLTVRSVTSPRHGAATIVGNGIAYRPNPDYHGVDSFAYTIVDDWGATASGRVQVTIHPVNDQPEAVDDTVTLLEDTTASVSVLANDQGLGDGVETVTVEADPEHGTATVEPDWTITYRPDPGFNGEDHFDYTVTDTDGDSSTATVRVTVLPVNDIPVAVDDTARVRVGKDVTIDVTKNDKSPDGIGDVKFADDSGGPTDAGEITTARGGRAKWKDRSVVYTPPSNLSGRDSFDYLIIDDDGDESNAATVTVSVENRPPTVRDGTLEVEQGQKVGGSLKDLVEDDDGELTFRLESGGGPVSIGKDGQFTYGPAGTPGTDEFVFSVIDGAGNEATGRVIITITSATATTSTGPSPPETQESSDQGSG